MVMRVVLPTGLLLVTAATPCHGFVPSRIITPHRLLHKDSTVRSQNLWASSASIVDADDNGSDDVKNRFLGPTLAIAVPAWISMMADPVLSLMDTAFVGRLGTMELAALGGCTSIFHLAFNAFRATTAATTSLVASSESRQDKQRVTQVSLQLGVAMGVVVLVLLKGCGAWALAQMGIGRSSPLFGPAQAYLQTRAWAGPAVLALVVSEGAFRGYGDTKIPLVASLVASLINLVLDPILMFPPIHWGVTGAATATALSQVGAVATYLYFLLKRQMLPRNKTTTTTTTPVGTLEPTEDSASQETTTKSTRQIVSTIVGANLAMMTKQGSLLLGWAYATARATRLGADHVAAHQVGLSFWLVFALWLDGAAVAAQVLVSQSLKRTRRVRSLTKYMFKVATVQGLLSTMLIFGMGGIVPTLFTTDETIRAHLRRLVPNLAWQQILISWTLVVESLAVGGQQFGLLAGGTILSTVGAVLQIRQCHTVQQIWARGIVSLFAGRLLTALIGTARVNRLSLRLPWRQ